MNEPLLPPQLNHVKTAAVSPDSDEGEISLLQMVDLVFDARWLIGMVAVVITGLGALYAIMAQPVYEANIMIQVEDSPNSAGSLLGQVNSLFDVKTAATAEIEILRSRMVVSRAVDNLRLYIDATPKRVPLVGAWMAGRASELSAPGLWGYGGFTWGTEKILVAAFNVPEVWQGQPFALEAGVDGRYRLLSPDNHVLEGTVGQLSEWDTPEGQVQLLVSELSGKPGAMFDLVRRSRLTLIERLQSDLKIAEKGRQSGVIGATLEGTRPRETADILNEIGREYVRQNVDRKAEEAANTLRFLEGQLPQIKRELEGAERTYSDFRNSKGTVDLGEEGRALLQQATAAETRLLEMRQKREELLSRFTQAHPTVQVLDKQMAEARAQAKQIANQIRKLPSIEQDTIRITRDVKVNNELYAGLLNSAQQLRLIKAGKVGNVRLVDAAVVPESPVKPRRSLILGLALLAGLFLGLLLAFLRKSMQGGIDDSSEIENKLGLTVYATIPHSTKQEELFERVRSKDGALGVLASVSRSDSAIESLRSLRTALQFAMLEAPNNIILITGATPSLGKSFVSVNFAHVLAATGKRTLLIDADLRKGYLHQYFGQERRKGLSEVVAGTVPFTDAVMPQLQPNLDFMCTGALPPNPAELLMSEHLLHLLQHLSARYDHIVIDSPPVLAVSDTAVLGRQVGAVFLVAREGVSTLGELEETQKRLVQSGVQVKGVIFNDIKPRPGRYGYGYRYRYKYGRYSYRYARYDYAPSAGESQDTEPRKPTP